MKSQKTKIFIHSLMMLETNFREWLNLLIGKIHLGVRNKQNMRKRINRKMKTFELKELSIIYSYYILNYIIMQLYKRKL